MGTLVRKEYHSRPLGRRTITKPKNECSKLASLATNPNSNPNSNLASLGHNIEERMLLTSLRSGITLRSECSKLASLAITSRRKKNFVEKIFSKNFLSPKIFFTEKKFPPPLKSSETSKKLIFLGGLFSGGGGGGEGLIVVFDAPARARIR